jgi:dolichol-phosphate mannosyltransferase
MVTIKVSCIEILLPAALSKDDAHNCAGIHAIMDGVLTSASASARPRDAVSGAIRPAPELTIVIPAFNERTNVAILVERLRNALAGIAWEAVFVDDNSPDGTAAAVREIGEQDDRIRCIRRIGRRGLAGACLEGMLSSQARYVAVMDADLQHDETLLASMFERLLQHDVDLVVASRYVAGGSATSFSANRARISRWSGKISRRFLKVELSDPMSGFFMIRRGVVEELAPSLSSQGFKILLDIVASAHGRLRVAELPFVFRERLHGESKLDSRIALDFVALLVAKLTDDAVSFRFLLFCMVGLTGVGVHMTVLLTTLHSLPDLRFSIAQAIATIFAIAWNFALNNALTYRDQRLIGRSFLTGLIRFEVICAVGALSNIGVASWIYEHDPDWWMAGLGGALMGAVWNYVVSAAFVWKSR